MTLGTIGTYGSLAMGILIAAAMLGPAALAQEPDEADATEEITGTGIRVVAHITVESGHDNVESLNANPAQAECKKPMLYLASHAAVILQHVFSAIAIDSPPSPVAGGASQSDSSELAEPAPGNENVQTVQIIQRTMFRTDI